MNVEEFDYELPKELIAQFPTAERECSRLLVLNRREGTIEHGFFGDLRNHFRNGDVLVLNDTRVFPARLKATKDTGGSVDILLTEKVSPYRWFCLVRGIRRGIGEISVRIGEMQVRLTRGEEFWAIEFPEGEDSDKILERYGSMPLPPYIRRKSDEGDSDFDRYQTVYAAITGSIAAPTAGFHFTQDLLDSIEAMGVNIVKVTLHIGIGTFFLVKTGNVEAHRMHREFYRIAEDAKASIRRAKDEGRRIIACGTSAVRTLETIYSQNGHTPLDGFTELFIYPGYRFKVVDGLITNFHLPRSTPLLLASAFAGREQLLRCYDEAIERNYRFYSYGDAMFIV
jgi:S-adenosylmethionine:tRNA ribosyltransferase-isomerase